MGVVHSRWDKYPTTYREKEMKLLANWIGAGESGAVVGLPGTGRATLLNVLCHRPEILKGYLQSQNQQAILVPVDLNNLPNNNLATLYRVILRSIHENKGQFDEPLQQLVSKLYEKYQAARDPFLSQSGLRELLLKFEAEEKKVVLVMNRFDNFCKEADPQMTGTLRGLRDSFKETLCYLMGMAQEVTYLYDLPSVEPMYSILDTHVLWVGPLGENDAIDMIKREVKSDLEAQSLEKLLLLTGGYPSLIRVVCHWWMETKGNKDNLGDDLLTKRSVQHRLSSLFNALTQEEQALLRDIAKRQKRKDASQIIIRATKQERSVLAGLCKKGVCRNIRPGWQITSQLMERYPNQAPGQSLGLIWWNEKTAEIRQGNKPVDLAPLEQNVLEFFIKNPLRRHTYSDLAESAWPDGSRGGVTTEAIQQVIRGIRKKVEPETAEPRYVISWRGQPEGGYQFFPEGRPT